MGLAAVDGSMPELFQSDGANQIVNREILEKAWRTVSQTAIDGLFLYSDQIANAIYPLLSRQGVRPDEDLQIISCNAEELFLSTLHPRPATIDIHPMEMGVRAVETIWWRLQNPLASPTVVVIRPKLVRGEKGT
jgi:DNA-binding LacI/PurR family transcriptional regulator